MLFILRGRWRQIIIITRRHASFLGLISVKLIYPGALSLLGRFGFVLSTRGASGVVAVCLFSSEEDGVVNVDVEDEDDEEHLDQAEPSRHGRSHRLFGGGEAR